MFVTAALAATVGNTQRASLTPQDAIACFCFDADNPPSPEVMARVNALYESAQGYQIGGSWSGVDGSPRALTWSLVPDGTLVPDGLFGGAAVANTLFASMDAKFATQGGRATWIAKIQQSFDRWGAISGLSYTRVSVAGQDWDDGAVLHSSAASATRGDVRISMRTVDGGSSVLAYNYFPSNGDMVLDSAENWASNSNDFRFFRNIVLHEHGHGVGMSHVCPANGLKLMEPFLNTNFDGPQHDDIRQAHFQYGDAYEPNNTFATAANLGAATAGVNILPSTLPAPAVTNGVMTAMSINGDVDYFTFTNATPLIAGSVTLTSVGSAYADYPQDAACNNTTVSTDSRVISNMGLEYRDSSDAVVRSSNVNAIGVSETLPGTLFSPPGAHYIRIFENDAPTQSQLYRITITSVTTPTLTASDNAFPFVRLDYTNVQSEGGYAIYRNFTPDRNFATLIATPGVDVVQFDDMTAAPGQAYYYWVEASQGTAATRPLAGPDEGTAQIVTPANDDCASATVVLEGLHAGDSTNATADGADNCGGGSTFPDVWYSYTASCPGSVHALISGGTLTSPLVTIHSGCPGTNANMTNCGGGGTSFDTVAGQVYYIRVVSTIGGVGTFDLDLNYDTAPNETCATATPVLAGQFDFNNCGSTTDGPAEACSITGDLWWVYTQLWDSGVNVNTCEGVSGFDTSIAVYDATFGCPAGPGTALVCNDNDPGCVHPGGSSANFFATAGVNYYIRVGSSSPPGSATLTIRPCADSIDFNNDGIFPDIQDLTDFLNVFSGGPCSTGTCSDTDYNNDGIFPDIVDLDLFLFIFSGGTC